MSIFQAIILGVVQGITEFLPVSSSAHLVIIPEIFNWEQQSLTFDIFAHAGTLVAIVLYYRKRLISIVNSTFKFGRKEGREERMLILNILLAAVPTVIIYFFVRKYLENWFENLEVIKFSLLFVGVLLILADLYSRKLSNYKKISPMTAILLGIGQGVSLIRGVSRSGAMLTIGLFAKAKRTELIEFILLASIPVILGGLLIEWVDYLQHTPTESAAVLIIGLTTSALSGYFAILLLNKFISKNLLIYSGIYRILIALVIFLT